MKIKKLIGIIIGLSYLVAGDIMYQKMETIHFKIRSPDTGEQLGVKYYDRVIASHSNCAQIQFHTPSENPTRYSNLTNRTSAAMRDILENISDEDFQIILLQFFFIDGFCMFNNSSFISFYNRVFHRNALNMLDAQRETLSGVAITRIMQIMEKMDSIPKHCLFASNNSLDMRLSMVLLDWHDFNILYNLKVRSVHFPSIGTTYDLVIENNKLEFYPPTKYSLRTTGRYLKRENRTYQAVKQILCDISNKDFEMLFREKLLWIDGCFLLMHSFFINCLLNTDSFNINQYSLSNTTLENIIKPRITIVMNIMLTIPPYFLSDLYNPNPSNPRLRELLLNWAIISNPHIPQNLVKHWFEEWIKLTNASIASESGLKFQ